MKDVKSYEYNKEYANEYLKKFEEIKIRVPKGEKDKIKKHAEIMGESVNGFINRAINETVKSDNL